MHSAAGSKIRANQNRNPCATRSPANPMLTVRRTAGDLQSVIAAIPNVPRRVIPYAASTALTRVAKHAATTVLPAEMRKSFSNPTSYTLNSLRVEPATTQTLSARVMVKDKSAGLPQERYLLPEVEGGQRNRKGLESALGYMGILRGGQYVMPGKAATLDASGNVSGAQVRTILAALKNIQSNTTGKMSRKWRGKKLADNVFAGKPIGGDRPSGIWRREGTQRGRKRLRPLFIFSDKAPNYTPALDFHAVVKGTALDTFRSEFQRAVADMLSKGATA